MNEERYRLEHNGDHAYWYMETIDPRLTKVFGWSRDQTVLGPAGRLVTWGYYGNPGYFRDSEYTAGTPLLAHFPAKRFVSFNSAGENILLLDSDGYAWCLGDHSSLDFVASGSKTVPTSVPFAGEYPIKQIILAG